MKLNNKGFSFVEVLAVIAILGILSSAAIIGVSRYKNEAVNKDYEALAKSSYNAMEEYIMANPYEKEVNLRELEENKFLSNRKDPASKTLNCEGSVVFEPKNGSDNEIDGGTYKVYLCCPTYKKIFTYPEGKIENLTDESKCESSGDDDEPIDPTPPTPPTPPTIDTIKVTFDCNGGTGGGSQTFSTGANGQKFNVSCSMDGYDQDGWKKKKNDSDKDYTTNNGVSDSWISANKPSITLYAHWIKEQITCSKGNYLKKNKKTCSKCKKDYYCPGGTFDFNKNIDQGINKCSTEATGYDYSEEGSDEINDCYMKVSKNHRVKKAKDPTESDCETGQTKEAHTVNYGKISSCQSKSVKVTFDCNGGVLESGPRTAEYHSDIEGQKFNTSCLYTGHIQDGWKRDKNATSSNYTVSSNVTENFVLTHSPAITIYAHWITKTVDCSAGSYLKQNELSCSQCKAGYYCPGGTYEYSETKDQGINKCSSNATGYNHSKAGSSKISQCYMEVSEDHYIREEKDSTSRNCPIGTYKEPHDVYYGKISSCLTKTVEVTFNCNGGNIGSGPEKFTYNSSDSGQKFTTTCVRSGYTQDGWKLNINSASRDFKTDSNVTENFVLTHTPSVTVYAHWVSNTTDQSYTCSPGNYLKKGTTSCSLCVSNYYCPGGTFKYDSTKDQGINKCSSNATGYDYSNAGSSKISECYMNVQQNRYVKEKYDSSSNSCPTGLFKEPHTVNYGKISSCSPKIVVVTFDCNGGTILSGPSSSTYSSAVSGQKFTTTCKKDGFTQDGWKRNRSSTSRDYTTNSNVTENFVLTYSPNITVYAHWNPILITCQPGYYLKNNNASCSLCLANNYCPGGTFEYSTSIDQGINKCKDDADGYIYSDTGKSKITDCYMKVPTNNYVKKAKDSSHTACPSGYISSAHNVYYGSTSSCAEKLHVIVAAGSNVGSVSVDGHGTGGNLDFYVTKGTKINISANTNDYYTFSGWKDKDGKSVSSSNPATVTINESKKIIANARENYVTIRYYANGAHLAPSPRTYCPESAYCQPSDGCPTTEYSGCTGHSGKVFEARNAWSNTHVSSEGVFDFKGKSSAALYMVWAGHEATGYWSVDGSSTKKINQSTTYKDYKALAAACGKDAELKKGDISLSLYAIWD